VGTKFQFVATSLLVIRTCFETTIYYMQRDEVVQHNMKYVMSHATRNHLQLAISTKGLFSYKCCL
jgi:hypothetical protein